MSACSASSRSLVLEQRDEKAGRERVAGGRAVDRFHVGRAGARDLLSVLEQQRALGSERHRDEPVSARERLELVAVDDRQVRIDLDGPAGAALRQKTPVPCLPRRLDRDIGHLELESTASCSGSVTATTSALAPGATTISVSPSASTRITAIPVGLSRS